MLSPHYGHVNRGTEAFVREISSRLIKRGHMVSILSGKREYFEIIDRGLFGGAMRKVIGIEPNISHFAYFMHFQSLLPTYDILWNNGEFFGALLCLEMKKRYGIPWVNTHHGNKSAQMIVMGLLKPNFYSVLTPDYANFLSKIVKCKVKCIPNGVDLDYFRPNHPSKSIYSLSKPHYVSTSAHEPSKHIDKAINYISNHKGSLIITSSGSQTKKLKQLCEEKLKGRYLFTGRISREELAGLLAYSDYYITFSSAEGHSLAVLEALASGLKIIAPEADKNMKWTIGSNNRAQAEKFSWESTVDKYENELLEVCQ